MHNLLQLITQDVSWIFLLLISIVFLLLLLFYHLFFGKEVTILVAPLGYFNSGRPDGELSPHETEMLDSLTKMFVDMNPKRILIDPYVRSNPHLSILLDRLDGSKITHLDETGSEQLFAAIVGATKPMRDGLLGEPMNDTGPLNTLAQDVGREGTVLIIFSQTLPDTGVFRVVNIKISPTTGIICSNLSPREG